MGIDIAFCRFCSAVSKTITRFLYVHLTTNISAFQG